MTGEHLHELLLIADVCELEPETGPCLAYKPQYFYNATSHKCERFVYGGCRGNGNRFRTKSQCQNTCQSEFQVKSLLVATLLLYDRICCISSSIHVFVSYLCIH